MHGPADALAYGVKVTGATLFVVDAGVDTGPIVAQAVVPVEDDDTVESLHERIKVAERQMLVDCVGRMAREGWTSPAAACASAAATAEPTAGPLAGWLRVPGRPCPRLEAHDWRRWATTGECPQHGEESASTAWVPSSSNIPIDEEQCMSHAARSHRRAVPLRRALVSVYDKTGLEDLARGLHDAGVTLVSTGGSAALIEGLGLPVTRVEDLTGFPECLDGRVKTLHPRVHAGILADRRLDSHVAQLAELGVEPFDLVVSNLYPFTQTVASGAGPDECVEQIDIGGPSMVRAAAKNHPSVAIVTSPGALRRRARRGRRRRLHPRPSASGWPPRRSPTPRRTTWPWPPGWATSARPSDSAEGGGFPAWIGATWEKAAVLRYGENPHQGAALYRRSAPGAAGWPQAEQLHGKEMSYNNYVDTDAARRAAYDFDEPAVAIIKHANPCGIAVGADVAEAHRKAHACDPVSAFGGVIAVNRPVSVAMAEQVAEVFTEVIVAPAYDEGAVEVLQGKKNIRILVCAPLEQPGAVEIRPISGGLLVQQRRPRRRARRRPVDLDARDRRGRLAGGARRPGLRLAGLPRGEVQRDPARQGRRLGRRRHGPGQPGRLLPARRRAGGGAGRRLGRRLRRVLPVRGRPADPHRRRRDGDRPARRLGARRADRRGLQGRGRDDVLHRHPALLPLTRRRSGAIAVVEQRRDRACEVATERVETRDGQSSAAPSNDRMRT